MVHAVLAMVSNSYLLLYSWQGKVVRVGDHGTFAASKYHLQKKHPMKNIPCRVEDTTNTRLQVRLLDRTFHALPEEMLMWIHVADMHKIYDICQNYTYTDILYIHVILLYVGETSPCICGSENDISFATHCLSQRANDHPVMTNP